MIVFNTKKQHNLRGNNGVSWRVSLPAVLTLLVFSATGVAYATAGTPARQVVTFSAKDSRNGVIVQAEDDTEAVSLPPRTSPRTGNVITWSPETPLAPGWWEVSVDFAVLPNDSLLIDIIIGSQFRPVFDVLDSGLHPKADSARFLLLNATPIASLEVRPRRTTTGAIRAIRQITFTPVEKPGTTDKPVLAEALVDASGTARFALGMPPGNWRIQAQGVPEGGEVIAMTNDDEKILMPGSDSMHLYVDGSLRELQWLPVVPGLKGVALSHLPRRFPRLQADGTKSVLSAVKTGEHTRIPLTFIGASAVPDERREAPPLPLFPNGASVAVITSWDDSPIEPDLRMARLLEKLGMSGTFFTTRRALTNQEYLLELESRGMEVASHTVNHPQAWLIDPESWAQECLQMRLGLEALVGHPVISFAYPYNYIRSDDAQGDYVLRGVRDAGYFSARTTRTDAVRIDTGTEPLQLSTNGHFKTSTERLDALWAVAKAQPGSIFYIWGHSWELHTDQQWSDFEQKLSAYANDPSAWYATQGQVFLWKWIRDHAQWEDVEDASSARQATLTYPRLDPWLQKQITMTVNVPAGTTRVKLQDGRELPVTEGTATLPGDIF